MQRLFRSMRRTRLSAAPVRLLSTATAIAARSRLTALRPAVPRSSAVASILGGALAMRMLSTSASAAGGEPLVKTASGLQYVERVVGKGERPNPGDVVRVHYTGTLDDGTVFDSSVKRNDPIEFNVGVGMVIPGWDEALLAMNVGGKRKLVIPPHLGYGRKAVGPIPANSTLTFEVELLEVARVEGGPDAGAAGPDAGRVNQTERLKSLSVQSTPSGLRYVDEFVNETGAQPLRGDTVAVHYTGRLADGTKFDSSRDRNEPFRFRVGAREVIAGWDEGVGSMKQGSRRILVVPPALGYGQRSVGPIPGGSTLYFDVELLKVGR